MVQDLLDCSEAGPRGDNRANVPKRVVHRRQGSTMLRMRQLNDEQGSRTLGYIRSIGPEKTHVSSCGGRSGS